MTTLALKTRLEAPLEAAGIVPERFAGRPSGAIAGIPVTYGNEPARLGDFFSVNGDGSLEIVLEGDMSRVKNIGAAMSRGKITVRGDAGMHLGAEMRGGEIEVHGNAGDWAGAEMKGGKIRIRGNAGHGLGGAYRGSRRGMDRGVILVDGNAGNEAGSVMRRGLIAVAGDAGDFAGAFMIAGTLAVFGHLGMRAGAGLLRGTIVTFTRPELLPTFRYDCSYSPGFLRLLLEDLRLQGMPVPGDCAGGRYRRYSGDFNRLGKGEILVYDQR
ncbi:MAG: formylmethanofuran dehydrogenase subunit C [Acidobacteria bacterium]|nr:formylmethanofuran dehydrogenase subunit C [Acidobacteriota bacterium]